MEGSKSKRGRWWRRQAIAARAKLPPRKKSKRKKIARACFVCCSFYCNCLSVSEKARPSGFASTANTFTFASSAPALLLILHYFHHHPPPARNVFVLITQPNPWNQSWCFYVWWQINYCVFVHNHMLQIFHQFCR